MGTLENVNAKELEEIRRKKTRENVTQKKEVKD